jgi:hypothetical protein
MDRNKIENRTDGVTTLIIRKEKNPTEKRGIKITLLPTSKINIKPRENFPPKGMKDGKMKELREGRISLEM